MSDAIESQGFTLQVSDSGISPLVLTTIGELTSFTGFDGQASEIDITHMQSTAKEFLMGLQDFGTFACECNYLSADAGQVELRAAKADRVVRTFVGTLSDGATFQFDAYVLGAPISGGVDAKVDGSFNLRITGDVVFA